MIIIIITAETYDFNYIIIVILLLINDNRKINDYHSGLYNNNSNILL